MSSQPVTGIGVPARGTAASLLRSSAVLGAALMAGNAANYFLAVAGSHRLSATGYGEFATLLAVLLVASIPSLAIQAVVARRTAVGAMARPVALRLGLLTGVVCAVVGFALLPGLAVFLHLPRHGLGLVGVMAALAPLGVLGAAQGHLQGSEEFGRLSALVVAIGTARILGGLLPLLVGSGPAVVLVGIAAGSLAVALLALRLDVGVASRVTPRDPPTSDVMSPRPRAGAALRRRSAGVEILAATASMGSVLLLSNLDLLLAKHLLPSATTGHYAAGNVVTKVAFWLPQAVTLTALPRLSHSASRRRTLRDAAAITAVVAAGCVVVTAVSGPTLTRLTFGSGYAGIGHLAWRFALEGGGFAAIQLLVVDDIANRRYRAVPLVLAAAAFEIAVALGVGWHRPRPIVDLAAATAVVLTVVAGWRVVRAPDELADPAQPLT
jgi:O-antigen/teichoic acid export membrane protein